MLENLTCHLVETGQRNAINGKHIIARRDPGLPTRRVASDLNNAQTNATALQLLDRHAKVWIQDMQGGTVKTFSGVKDQTVEWDAAGMGNGVYLFQVSAGNRRFVQKASILR